MVHRWCIWSKCWCIWSNCWCIHGALVVHWVPGVSEVEDVGSACSRAIDLINHYLTEIPASVRCSFGT